MIFTKIKQANRKNHLKSIVFKMSRINEDQQKACLSRHFVSILFGEKIIILFVLVGERCGLVGKLFIARFFFFF